MWRHSHRSARTFTAAEEHSPNLANSADPNRPIQDDSQTLTSVMTGLPIGLLITQPFIEVAKAQAKPTEVDQNTITNLSFKTDENENAAK